MSIEEDEEYQEELETVEEELEAGEGEEEDDAGEGEEEAEDGAVEGDGIAGPYNAQEVNEVLFEELVLPPLLVADVQRIWGSFLSGGESMEAAGEAIYAALFDAAPSLQNLFKTPRAVMSMRFIAGLNSIINNLGKPKELKTLVETLGFQHLDLEVTVPRVAVFRDAIVDLVSMELGAHFTPQIHAGLATVLNYSGGAFIYIRTKYSERLKTIASSWALANKKESQLGEADEDPDTDRTAESPQDLAIKVNDPKKKSSGKRSWLNRASGGSLHGNAHAAQETMSKDGNFKNTSVPQTFEAMFAFNVAVMGMSGHTWMGEVLSSFDAIVTNVANSYRLQEECDVLSLRLAKHKGPINLNEFKSVMLASLRSLCKDWGSNHEVAWTWLWSNVERLLNSSMGKPQKQELALAKLLNGLDDTATQTIRREVYVKFFALAPSGQDHFKQSSTRLHFIVDKLMMMTQEMYKNPKKMVDDISALGLRHVGYGIPTDLFGPFVTACVEVVRKLTDNVAAEEAFRWSLGLISRILVRVIGEGSTIVMRAINANSARMLKRAVDCAPRGKRAMWVLNVQVGTQSISPLMLAIQNGSLEAAEAIIVDLLTIRADRDRYYYGIDLLFQRHDDIVKRLCADAPPLLQTFLNGMIWRCRTTEGGLRRVNYYVKHLIVGADGRFARAIEWITDFNDPRIICHPVMSLVLDIVWGKAVLRRFLLSKAWFLFTLAIYASAQSLLVHRAVHDHVHAAVPIVVTVVILRVFIYVFSLGLQVVHHARAFVKAVRAKDFTRWRGLPIPAYLNRWQESAGLLLTCILLTMLCLEPTLHCLHDPEQRSIDVICEEVVENGIMKSYSILSCIGMVLYFLLLTDLSVLSTKVSAFTITCRRVSDELFLSLGALLFLAVAFSMAVTSLDHADESFDGMPLSFFHFLKITLNMMTGEEYTGLETSPALVIFVMLFSVIAVVFLLNVLIAQLVCAYQATYEDMEGYARLSRGRIVTEIMPQVSEERWEAFVEGLSLDVPVEFGEGDIGLAGGVQVVEPASANITTQDTIRRYGGTTDSSAPWPQDELDNADEDKFERLEKYLDRAMKKISKSVMGSSKGSGFASSLTESAGVSSHGHASHQSSDSG